jgi:anaerobic ribonucleoside-triphosphate reductase
MNSKIVYQGQSFIDKVLENTGSIENVFAMAVLNGASITDELVIGNELKTVPITNQTVVNFFNEFNKPASAITSKNYELIVADEGIGAMVINDTFIIR